MSRNVYFQSVILSRDRHESRREIGRKGKMEGKIRETDDKEERIETDCSPVIILVST